MRVGIIGMGNMGSKYAGMIVRGSVAGMELVAVTRVNGERWDTIKDFVSPELVRVNSGDEMFALVDEGRLELDAVLIVTPHYSHEELAIKAFEREISVLCDKPAGVYTRQARNMMSAYSEAKQKNSALQYGYVFHQRTFPMYIKIKELVNSGKYGHVRRVNWVVTDWYRPNSYYESGSWRATYKYDGGGTLLNQCPHNLDLLAWICGEPSSVVGFCNEGKYHNIEVEDDVTLYMEWKNGATGVFIASTGEAAGVNRLEISLDDALIVCEKGKLRLGVLDKPEAEYRSGNGDMFAKPVCEWQDIDVEPVDRAYEKVLEAFVQGKMIAAGDEAIDSLYISNAAYLSSWENHRKVNIPTRGSEYELEFEKAFEEELNLRSHRPL
jgi:predicted dehydrogenase